MTQKRIAEIFEQVGLAEIAREIGNEKLHRAMQEAMMVLHDEMLARYNAVLAKHDALMAQYAQDDTRSPREAAFSTCMSRELAIIFTTALSRYIDANREEGAMCMSSAECVKMEQCFMRGEFGKIEAYLKGRIGSGEDERIRRELIEAFTRHDPESSWNGIPVRDIIAWLEKHNKQR